jgi:predicted ribosomally synthesized peptide with nif11-like leader
MSIENAQSFYVRVSSDKEFRTQLEQTETIEERQQIIQTAGYKFTAEEWEIAKEQILATSDSSDSELSEEELTTVSGGVESSVGDFLKNKPLFPFTPIYGSPSWDA